MQAPQPFAPAATWQHPGRDSSTAQQRRTLPHEPEVRPVAGWLRVVGCRQPLPRRCAVADTRGHDQQLSRQQRRQPPPARAARSDGRRDRWQQARRGGV